MRPINKLFALLLLTVSLTNCNKIPDYHSLVDNDTLSFVGTFKCVENDLISGEISLTKFNNHYLCSTDIPYGLGSGILTITESHLTFTDTLFFVVPALYGPSYVLSGDYSFKYNGADLTIWKEINAGKIVYSLHKKTN